MKKIISFLYILFSFTVSHASHLVVGEMSYKYLGNNLYEFTVYYYRDCINGNPAALQADNPIFISVFNGQSLHSFDSIFVTESALLPPQNPNTCESSSTTTCIERAKFQFTKNLPPSPNEYLILNARCCMSESISNISNPGTLGHSFYCKIPPNSNGLNSSASFAPVTNTKFCLGKKYIIDHSAIDSDGDSLSYGFDLLDKGGDINDPKPIIFTYPSFVQIPYKQPYSVSQPIPGLSMDEQTGILTLNSLLQGTYAVNVLCHEWRNGVKINTIKRTYIYTISNCQFEVQASIACDSTLYQTTNGKFCISNCNGKTINFKSKNTNNVIQYHWDFGVAGQVDDTSNIANPIYTYPDTGMYKVTLYVYGANCTDSIVEQIAVYDESPVVDFTISGKLCTGSDLAFAINANDTFTYARWDFTPALSALYGNPITMKFFTPGLNQIHLTAYNQHGCKAEQTKEINLSTITVKLYSDTTLIMDNAAELVATGADYYKWDIAKVVPANYFPQLNPLQPDSQKALISSPAPLSADIMVTGIQMDGCASRDTVKVTFLSHPIVEGEGTYFVPNAFTPNGDNLNDLVRIYLSGYNFVNFKVYNRRGQQVFFTTDKTQGWDGTFKGEKMGMDTYFWMATLRDMLNKEFVVGGDVILMR